jgi:hypothetical protein
VNFSCFCLLIFYIGGDFNKSSWSLVRVLIFLVIFVYMCLGGAFSTWCTFISFTDSFSMQFWFSCGICVCVCECAGACGLNLDLDHYFLIAGKEITIDI